MNYLTFKTLFKKESFFLLLKIFVPTIALLWVIFTVGKMNGVSFGYLSRDAIQTLWHEPNAEVEFYIGLLSNIGVIFWCFTAAILFFSAKLAKDYGKPKKVMQFFFYSGILTAFFLVDDLFLMHDVIIPYFLHISEKFLYLFYGFYVLALFYLFREIIKESDYLLFLLAFLSMTGSVITDVILTLGFTVKETYLFEDGLKFIGIISWFVYFARTSYNKLKHEA
ncbi:hypothetical protein JYB62_07145 [Algoriphagus lutimaris]|uniref:hypothetical protein n=1 Tax=Algoriphagus lutimaris TaxID=613197 RepID=UPI00196ABA9B|nr:hypothetical protein [Algoriphagus lutimaris]MBN3519775.1 hypothetical protein [Algoriphagus lutimaris]